MLSRYGRRVTNVYEPKMGRIPIRDLAPQQPDNNWPAKAFVGEVVPFQATVFKEGHDILGVDLLLTTPDGVQSKHRMHEAGVGFDRWEVEVLLDLQGTWVYSVQAWNDDWATWLHMAEIKIPAGIDVKLMLLMGTDLLARAVKGDPTNKILTDTAKVMGTRSLSPTARFEVALDPRVTAEIGKSPLASLTTLSLPLEVRVERARAGSGSW